MTGGGAQLKHISQLCEFKTGMDTRIGYPNEHLANDVPEEMASPMYSTGIGLVIIGIDRYEKEKEKRKINEPEPEIVEAEDDGKGHKGKKTEKPKKSQKKFTDSFVEKITKFFNEENE